MNKEFIANRKTMREALRALREAEYPKRAGEPSGTRAEWEAHQRELMEKLYSMTYGGKVG